MKKFLFILPLLMVAILGLYACGMDMSSYFKSNVSEVCESYYVGETNDYYVNLFSGEREKTYKLDGISTENVDYAILSVKCKSAQIDKEVQYSIEIDDKTYDGVLNPNPYDNTLEADIERLVSGDAVVYAYIKVGEDTQVANLKCVSKEFFVAANTALDIAIDEIINEKVEFDTSKKYECFVQVLNKDDANKLYFWIVSVVSDDGEVFNVIIDTSTGKVLAKNCNNLQ